MSDPGPTSGPPPVHHAAPADGGNRYGVGRVSGERDRVNALLRAKPLGQQLSLYTDALRGYLPADDATRDLLVRWAAGYLPRGAVAVAGNAAVTAWFAAKATGTFLPGLALAVAVVFGGRTLFSVTRALAAWRVRRLRTVPGEVVSRTPTPPKRLTGPVVYASDTTYSPPPALDGTADAADDPDAAAAADDGPPATR